MGTIKKAILDFTLEHPTHEPLRVARALVRQGIQVSFMGAGRNKWAYAHAYQISRSAKNPPFKLDAQPQETPNSLQMKWQNSNFNTHLGSEQPVEAPQLQQLMTRFAKRLPKNMKLKALRAG